MILTVFSENGRGRHLCRWALERGFQVNMVVSDQENIQELPFGEKIDDKNTDWAQDFFLECENNSEKTIELTDFCEFTKFGQKAVSVSAEQTLFSSMFDWNEVNSTNHEKLAPLYQRQWGVIEWKNQLKKMTHMGLELNGNINSVLNEVVIDFRSDLKRKPLWQWAAYTFQWDLGLYQDVMPSQFLWIQNQEEYFAYENFSYVERSEDQWKVFVKLPYQPEPSAQTAEAVISGWFKNFTNRWGWVKADWTGQWQLLPFYQWKKEQRTDTASQFYDMGPKVLGSYSFEKQWKLEQKIFRVLTESHNQNQKNSQKNRKKSGYDFKIHAS